MSAPDKSTLVMKFKLPTGSLPLYLSRTEMAVVPAEIAKATGKDQFKDFIGTGPYKFVERQPDRYTRFARFDNYAARDDAADGWAGKKTAYIDTLEFIPVTEDAVRTDGMGTGEYLFADPIPPDPFDTIKANPQLVSYVVNPITGTSLTSTRSWVCSRTCDFARRFKKRWPEIRSPNPVSDARSSTDWTRASPRPRPPGSAISAKTSSTTPTWTTRGRCSSRRITRASQSAGWPPRNTSGTTTRHCRSNRSSKQSALKWIYR